MTIKDLTTLQAEMDLLAGVKCPCAKVLPAHPPGPALEIKDQRVCGSCWTSQYHDVDHCEACNGSGLDPKYDCLRVRCWQPCRQTLHWTESDYAGTHVDPVLPADRAHEAVGKLLVTTPLMHMFHGRGDNLWHAYFVENRGLQQVDGNTPTEVILFALYEASKVATDA